MKSAELLIKELKQKSEEELLNYLGDEEKLSKLISSFETIDKNTTIDIIGDILSGKEIVIDDYKPKQEVSPNSKLETTTVINKTDGGFWSFDKMISGNLIKFLYILGLIALIILGIGLIIQGANSRYGGEILIFSGIGTIIIGNLLWRIICEGIIIIFKIFEKLNQIEKKVN